MIQKNQIKTCMQECCIIAHFGKNCQWIFGTLLWRELIHCLIICFSHDCKSLQHGGFILYNHYKTYAVCKKLCAVSSKFYICLCKLSLLEYMLILSTDVYYLIKSCVPCLQKLCSFVIKTCVLCHQCMYTHSSFNSSCRWLA